jgi:hypothetical protein
VVGIPTSQACAAPGCPGGASRGTLPGLARRERRVVRVEPAG